MKCEEAREHLSTYLDEMLEQDVRSQLEDHLSECEGCNEELKELKRVIDSVSSLDQVKAPSDFLNSVKKRLEPRFSLRKFIKTIFLPLQIKIPMQAAAVTVSVLLVFALVQQLQKSTDEFPGPIPSEPRKKIEASKYEAKPKRHEPVKPQAVYREQDKESTSEELKALKGIGPKKQELEIAKESITKKKVLPPQLNREKEEASQDGIALKPGALGKTHQEMEAMTGSEGRLEPEPRLESRVDFLTKEIALQAERKMKELPKIKPVELVIFIHQAKPASSEAMAKKRMERVEESVTGGMAEKKGATLARQRSFTEAEIKEKSLEDQNSDQGSPLIEDVSELATEGILAEIQKIVFEFKGKVITSIQSSQLGTPSLIKTEIPEKSYHDFCNKLKTLSPQTTCPAVDSRPDQAMIPVNIKIFQK